MAIADVPTTNQPPAERARPAPHVAPSPHLSNLSTTTNWMMYDVMIGLAPVMAMSIVFFRWNAAAQVGLCVLASMGFEWLFARMRGRTAALGDGSAAVTGAILGLSLPWNAPWHVAVIGSGVAIGLGKAVFGGLGFNIFNPAMAGRAFAMLSFPAATGAAAYIGAGASSMELVSQATPLAAAKAQAGAMPEIWPLLIGSHNGSLGETSVLAILAGGVYLCYRRSASWEIPVGLLLSVSAMGLLIELLGLTRMTVLQQLCSGSVFFGAFFIATDPVSSPLTPKGKFWFAAGIGVFTVVIRAFSGYPEGVMFAVLLMNAAVPLINQWTIPRPLGGAAPPRGQGA